MKNQIQNYQLIQFSFRGLVFDGSREMAEWLIKEGYAYNFINPEDGSLLMIRRGSEYEYTKIQKGDMLCITDDRFWIAPLSTQQHYELVPSK